MRIDNGQGFIEQEHEGLVPERFEPGRNDQIVLVREPEVRNVLTDRIVELQGRYYRRAIECFGPDRCMFESNFPVDRFSLSYPVLWNGLKMIAARYAPGERAAMFEGTARRVYGI